MGWVLVHSPCFACKRVFGYNPHRVPSIPIDDKTGQVSPTGDRKPICRDCITVVNAQREAAGLPVWNVSDDAYEPIEEGQL